MSHGEAVYNEVHVIMRWFGKYLPVLAI